MLNRFRWLTPFALLLAVSTVLPAEARASRCVDEYTQCLNDTWDTSGFLRVLADVGCFAEYVGCVRRSL